MKYGVPSTKNAARDTAPTRPRQSWIQYSTEPGAPNSYGPYRGNSPTIPVKGSVRLGAAIFLAEGAKACAEFLGPRFKTLAPLVMRRAQYLDRCAKRLERELAFQQTIKQAAAEL